MLQLWWNHLMILFLECIPIIKQSVTIYKSCSYCAFSYIVMWIPATWDQCIVSAMDKFHMDYRNPLEKKGWQGYSLRERARGPEGPEGPRSRPLPGQAFIAFLGTLHWGWSSFTRFAVGDYLLQITKERRLLITSKRRMLQLKGKSGCTGYTPYLCGLAQTLGSSRYWVNICCLNTGEGVLAKASLIAA